jgi:hypothetical protein
MQQMLVPAFLVLGVLVHEALLLGAFRFCLCPAALDHRVPEATRIAAALPEGNTALTQVQFALQVSVEQFVFVAIGSRRHGYC